jgi:hypothetical protein
MSEKLNAAIAALERCLDSLKAESTGTPVRAVADLPKRPLLTPLQAAEARNGANKDLLRSVTARAARLGFRIEADKIVDVSAFDAAAKGKDISERLAIKAAMFKLGLIPA